MHLETNITYAALRDQFEIVNKYPIFKFLIGLFFAFIDWAMKDHFNTLSIIFVLILLDTFTGVWKSASSGKLSSVGFSRFFSKLIIYFIMLITSGLVDRLLPVPIAVSITGAFLGVTESISILENISILGFPVPLKLLNMLETYRKKSTK